MGDEIGENIDHGNMIKKVAGRYMSGKESNFTDSTLHLEGRELVVLDGTGTEIQRANFNE